MNAVEISEAVAELVENSFNADEFPYEFLRAFDNPETTIQRLKSGVTNRSDVGGVLQRNNIHILVCDSGELSFALEQLRKSAATGKQKAKFILATDGLEIEAEDLNSGEILACSFKDLEGKFGFFLPLANITTVREIRNSSFDIKATGRLNKLYIELLKHNSDWTTEDRRHEMNHFMARLVFCFFSEDTGIFAGENLFTGTLEDMSAADGTNVHWVLEQIFSAMNTPEDTRKDTNLPRWTYDFPYVNGGLFSGSTDVPSFSKIARTFLLHIGKLDWTKINPDVFGSMIQAVARDEQRSELGMHYTSVPNILKVLNPLFLDDLRQRLAEAGTNARKLLNLRNRIKRIRVFDPACGSGNFLVIAYKEMRAIEAEINTRREENNRPSEIPITNFRGIEMIDFAAEMARLALIIAEYQCDATHVGRRAAIAAFLPLDSQNWITCGNALRLDWLSICPPTGEKVKHIADDLFMTPLDQAEIDFENEGGETFICGNPPYIGSQDQTPEQKRDLREAFQGAINSTASADYVSGWFIKASMYVRNYGGVFAFVTTNSICQGRQVALYWSAFLANELEIKFAEPSLKWSNLAQRQAAVIVSIIGLGLIDGKLARIFNNGEQKEVNYIGPYLVPDHSTIVVPSRRCLSELTPMTNGSMPNDGGGLILSKQKYQEVIKIQPEVGKFMKKFIGSHDGINGDFRYCIWIEDGTEEQANENPFLAERIATVKKHRLESSRYETNQLASKSHAFGERRHQNLSCLLIPRHSSERRQYLPSILVDERTVVGDSALAMYDPQLYDFAVFSSRMHQVWTATVCGKIKEDFRYSNTLGWNTFPLPKLTGQQKEDLNSCAIDILVAREMHFPLTIAELYDPDEMPDNLRAAHEHNDEVLERILSGRRFKNDTERLEKLFSMYTKMTTTIPIN